MATYKELLAQAEELSRQAEEMRLKEVQGVISDIKAKMEDYGITIEDLQSKSRGSSAGKPRGRSRINMPRMEKPGRVAACSLAG